MKKIYIIYIVYEEDRRGGEYLTSGEYSNRKDLCISVKWKNAYLKDTALYQEEVKIDFDPNQKEHVYSVVVRYSSGDTFGNSYGNWQMIGVYKSGDEAQNMIKMISEGRYKGPKLWDGYFEELEDIELNVHHVVS